MNAEITNHRVNSTVPCFQHFYLVFKMFLDCSAIDDRFIDARTLLASSLKEILEKLLHRQMKQVERSEERAHENEARERRDRKGESVQALVLRDAKNAH